MTDDDAPPSTGACSAYELIQRLKRLRPSQTVYLEEGGFTDRAALVYQEDSGKVRELL